MDDDQLDDLKQFITTTVSQTEARLTERIDKLETKVDKLEVKLETKIDDVDAKADAILEAVGESFDNHEVRIKKLETSHSSIA
jgi:hypothetical protein